MAVCQLRQPRENTACRLLFRLLCQPGENSLQFLWLLEFSSSFPACALPSPGSENSVHGEEQQDNWHSWQDTQEVEEPEAPTQSMCYQAAPVLSVWKLMEDWEAVGGSPDNIEKAWQVVSSRLPDKVAGTVGWIFLTALKVNMDSALCDATQVCQL